MNLRHEHPKACGLASRRQFLTVAGGAAGALLVASPAAGAPAPDRPARRAFPFRLGLASYTLRKFKLPEAIAMTRRVGLDHICLKSFHVPLESTLEEIEAAAAQFKSAGIVLYAGGVITMRTAAEVDQAFAYARAAGMTTIIGVPYPEVLSLVEAKAKSLSIKVAIHNHGPGDKVYPTPRSAYEKIKGLDPRIGLCIDVGHTIRVGDDPYRAIEDCADRLIDLHVKDVTAAAPEGEELEIGRGIIDVPRLMRALLARAFSGVVAFEYEKDPDDPLAGLAESVGYVKGVLAAL
jgi:sugar phosphate isomerase/epimerase